MSEYLDLKPGPFQKTSIDGGLDRLVRIWEYLRDLNEGGYGSGRLVEMKAGPGKTSNKKTDCSPFTATCIYLAVDSRPVDVKAPHPTDRQPFDPRFNGGEVLGSRFYHLHNAFKLPEYKTKAGKWEPQFKKNYVDRIPNLIDDWKWIDDSAGSVVIHNLGEAVDDRKMRRGDLVGINWMSGGGHAVFCWNVHLDKAGEVDCFQYVSSNGSGQSGLGVTVCQLPAGDKSHLTFSNGKYTKVKDMFTGIIDDPKAYPEYVSNPYTWYALRHLKKGGIDKGSFGLPKKQQGQIVIVDHTDVWKGLKLGVDKVMVARLFGVEPPEPWLKAGDATTPAEPAPQPEKPKPLATVKSEPIAAQAEPKKEKPKVAPEGEAQPHQLEVEAQLQQLWIARWIGTNPGDSKDVNDAKSQAAIQDFQAKYLKGEKVPQPGHADPATRRKLAAYAAWAMNMPNVNLALRTLHDRGQLEGAPGEKFEQLDEKSLAAVKEFQKQKGLEVDGIPGPQTQKVLAAALKAAPEPKAEAAPAAKPGSTPAAKPGAAPAKPAAKGKEPALWAAYFTRNVGKPGDKATVAVVAFECEKKKFSVGLWQDGKALLENAGEVTIKNGKGRLEVQIPAGIAPGAMLEARVAGEGLKIVTPVLFEIDDGAAGSADWRPYLGKDEVPAAVLEAIRRNRARYPARELTPVASDQDKYRGANHYNYDPPADHAAWAKEHFSKKQEDGASRERKYVVATYFELLDHEGRPASMQTYDSQVVTWGVGTGAMGNGKEVFTNLNKDPRMKALLDGIGINFFDGDYHVVDLAQRKVITSPPGKKTKYDPTGKGDDSRHRMPLESARRQPDLLSALIGLSEDKDTREAVADAQFDVYLNGAGAWPGQDKIFTQALFFMITHMLAWYPDYAKNGFNVKTEFAKIGGQPSVATDQKLAPVLANAFIRRGKSKLGPGSTYDDLRTRTKTHLWEVLRSDGKKEGLDPGAFVYDSDL